MSSLRRFGFLFLSLLAVALPAGEKLVAITPELTGAWVTPDGKWDGRTVLLLHGFADDMDGAGDLTKRLAGELAAHGIASLRINFRGEGDKKRTNIESTLATRLADVEEAYGAMVEKPGLDMLRVGVCGWSLGATTAIEYGAQHTERFKTMALWSSPSGDMFAMWQSNPTAQAALRDGVATEDVPGWKKITTKREFYESFRGVNSDKSLAKYPGAFLTIRGSNDMLTQHDADFMKILAARSASMFDAKEPRPPAEAVLIGGADHIFNVFTPGAAEPARVIELTVAWFERTL